MTQSRGPQADLSDIGDSDLCGVVNMAVGEMRSQFYRGMQRRSQTSLQQSLISLQIFREKVYGVHPDATAISAPSWDEEGGQGGRRAPPRKMNGHAAVMHFLAVGDDGDEDHFVDASDKDPEHCSNEPQHTVPKRMRHIPLKSLCGECPSGIQPSTRPAKRAAARSETASNQRTALSSFAVEPDLSAARSMLIDMAWNSQAARATRGSTGGSIKSKTFAMSVVSPVPSYNAWVPVRKEFWCGADFFPEPHMPFFGDTKEQRDKAFDVFAKMSKIWSKDRAGEVVDIFHEVSDGELDGNNEFIPPHDDDEDGWDTYYSLIQRQRRRVTRAIVHQVNRVCSLQNLVVLDALVSALGLSCREHARKHLLRVQHLDRLTSAIDEKTVQRRKLENEIVQAAKADPGTVSTIDGSWYLDEAVFPLKHYCFACQLFNCKQHANQNVEPVVPIKDIATDMRIADLTGVIRNRKFDKTFAYDLSDSSDASDAPAVTDAPNAPNTSYVFDDSVASDASDKSAAFDGTDPCTVSGASGVFETFNGSFGTHESLDSSGLDEIGRSEGSYGSPEVDSGDDPSQSEGSASENDAFAKRDSWSDADRDDCSGSDSDTPRAPNLQWCSRKCYMREREVPAPVCRDGRGTFLYKPGESSLGGDDDTVAAWSLEERWLVRETLAVFKADPCRIAAVIGGTKSCRDTATFLESSEMSDAVRSIVSLSKKKRLPIAMNRGGGGGDGGGDDVGGDGDSLEENKDSSSRRGRRNNNMIAKEAADSDDDEEEVWKVKDFVPCAHAGSCAAEGCSCFVNNLRCEVTCGCNNGRWVRRGGSLKGGYVVAGRGSAHDWRKICTRRHMGCFCGQQGLKCVTSKCLCRVIRRACDPDFCQHCQASALPELVHHEQRNCRNVDILTGWHKKSVIGNSLVHGYGLFAVQRFRKGEIIGKYGGSIMDTDRAECIGFLNDAVNSTYFFESTETLVICGKLLGMKTKFINFAPKGSKLQNAKARPVNVRGFPHVALFAARQIEPGEEICFEYGFGNIVPDWAKDPGEVTQAPFWAKDTENDSS